MLLREVVTAWPAATLVQPAGLATAPRKTSAPASLFEQLVATSPLSLIRPLGTVATTAA